MSNTVLYDYGDQLYLNITNRCPCRCTFCIRNYGDGVNLDESLWLEQEPDTEEIKAAIRALDWARYSGVVFCGYGEPTERLDTVIEIGQWIRQEFHKPVRLNTNGLSDLINGRKTAESLADAVDTVSISLNAPTKEAYNAVCRPVFGEQAFDAMLAFAMDCKKHIPAVFFSVVDVIGAEQIEQCRRLCDGMGIPLRVRKMSM